MAPDTIAAIATPAGQGGVGIVRVSGSGVEEIAIALLGRLPKVRQAELHEFRDADNTLIDTGLVLYWVVNNTLSITQQWVITKRIERGGKK